MYGQHVKGASKTTLGFAVMDYGQNTHSPNVSYLFYYNTSPMHRTFHPLF